MNEEIDSINQILPTASAGSGWDDEVFEEERDEYEDGEKARAIRTWIRSVLRKIIHYKAEHQRLLDEATTSLQLALPHDIVKNNVLPFLELPSNTFEVSDHEEEEGDDSVHEEEAEEEEHGDDDDDEFDDDDGISITSLEGEESRKRRRMGDQCSIQ